MRRPLHVRCLFNKLLTLMRTFRLAHCGKLRFAPPRVEGITLLNRQWTGSEKAIAREMFVQQAAHANADVSTGPLREATIRSTKSRRDYTLESTADEFCEA